MIIRIFAAAAALTMLVTVGCGDDDNGSTPGSSDQAILRLFDPAGGDALARTMLPEIGELPGEGWEETARDAFDDDDADGEDPFENLPSCQHLNELDVSLGSLGGSADDALPAGRAQVEYSRSVEGGILATSVEVETEITETVAETQSGWSIARSILTSDETKRCFEDLFSQAFAEQDETSQFTVEMASLDPLAAAPHDGVSLAFGMKLSMNRVELLDARFELHIWPYSNASVSVLLFSETEALTAELASQVLSTIDAKVVAAGAEQ